jgi:hypothetical protein
MGVAEQPGGVALVGTGASVHLKSIGGPRMGFPATCAVAVGSLRASLNCELLALDQFAEEAMRLHEKLEGTARIWALDEEFRLTLTGTFLGHVDVDLKLVQRGSADFDLNAKFEVDQSHLPALVRAIRVEFLNRAEP